jgi:hypothetical protein
MNGVRYLQIGKFTILWPTKGVVEVVVPDIVPYVTQASGTKTDCWSFSAAATQETLRG